ncbi:hypothetical protein KA043_02580 [Candidatus Saccharibacteria bacterium]|jgi:archaellum component FlaC|nr:hypothetical protein [Candidatus Saccharibacteria bacterium]
MSNPTATRKDIDEILDLMQTFMHQVDNRFNTIETDNAKVRKDLDSILKSLDSIEKDIQLNEDERSVMGMQLTRLHDWVEKTASKVGVEFVH